MIKKIKRYFLKRKLKKQRDKILTDILNKAVEITKKCDNEKDPFKKLYYYVEVATRRAQYYAIALQPLEPTIPKFETGGLIPIDPGERIVPAAFTKDLFKNKKSDLKCYSFKINKNGK